MYHFDKKLFNPQQLEAVLHDEGPMLVLAGAGSGKTRIIAHRVAYLVDCRGVDPESIVAVSFTNKAARELKKRVAELIGPQKAAHAHLSTFHSLGADILRAHISKLGWKMPFAILDTDDQLGILKNVLKDLRLQGTTYDPQALLQFVSRVKTAHVGPLDLPGMRWNPHRNALKKIFDQYQMIRRSMNAIDFDDMIAMPTDLFEQYPDVLSHYASSWRYLLVDEYQDTNALQFRMLQLLCRDRANLMVVGDDDQSIYAFRGADSKHILEFPSLFDNVRVVSLEQNYRSTQIILDAANAVIARNATRHQKNLWSENAGADRIQCYACASPEDEAAFIVEQLRHARAMHDLDYRDFAVLYRTNPQSRVLEDKFVEAGIPYRIVGGSKFYDHAEVRDLVFYLRSAFSSHDELALRRIINTPRRGIAAASLARIDARAKAQNISFFEAIRLETQSGDLPAAARLKLTEFVDLLDRYHRRFMAKSEPIATTMEAFIRDIHYVEYIQSSSSSDEQARHRRENVDELLNAIAAYERHEGRDLLGFLQGISLDPPQKNEDEHPDEVTLMTLHSSKGLEFPAVYIAGCEDNLIPHANSLQEPALSEERRLFYVGITRAKRYLTLTYSQARRRMYETIAVEPSRFLRDIPEHTIERHEAAAAEVSQKIREEKEAVMADRLAQMRALFKKK